MLQGPPPPEKLRRPSEGWVIQIGVKEGFVEIPNEPRLVFPAWHIAWNYARHRLGKEIQLRWLWGVFPWPCQVWVIVPFKISAEPITPQNLVSIVPAEPITPQSLVSSAFAEDSKWITVICECHEEWCNRPLLIPSEAYEEVRKHNYIVRHAECETVPNEYERFMGTVGNWQIWKKEN